MKQLISVIISYSLLVSNYTASAQEKLTLQQAYDEAQQNYPIIKQRELIKQTAQLSVENLSKGFLPQFSFNGQATYQSDVTKIDISLPGISIQPLSKDQYKVTADLNQLIYDGGVTKQQKNLQQLNADVQEQQVEVDLYKLKDRINQLFLGVLYLDEQLKQVELVKADLNVGIKKVSAQVNNGVAYKSDLNTMQAQLLTTDQRAIELQYSRKGYLQVLGLFLNRTLPENIQLEKPVVATPVLNEEIQRPELKLFSTQDLLLNGQYKLINAKNLPKASFFFEGGYGKPGLNLLKNEFDPYYITGLRLNWSFGGLYTQKKEKQLVDINKKIVDVQKETFLLNTNTALKQQQSEVDKYQKLVSSDQDIIDLREKVKQAAQARLENSVITADDYLREVNAEDQARQNRIIHEIQLLQAEINYQTTAGKQ